MAWVTTQTVGVFYCTSLDTKYTVFLQAIVFYIYKVRS